MSLYLGSITGTDVTSPWQQYRWLERTMWEELTDGACVATCGALEQEEPRPRPRSCDSMEYPSRACKSRAGKIYQVYVYISSFPTMIATTPAAHLQWRSNLLDFGMSSQSLGSRTAALLGYQ